MAVTTVPTTLQVKQWQNKFHTEYVRRNQLKPLMGKTEEKPIQLVMDLAQKPGTKITVQLVARIEGDPIYNDDRLMNNEVQMSEHGHEIEIFQIRQGVARTDYEQKKGNIEILPAARMMLRKYFSELLRNDILKAFDSPVIDGVTTYAASTPAQRNAWQTLNTDRIQYGALKSNLTAGDHATSLSTIDGSADTLTPGLVSLFKRMMRTADPHIMPISVKDDGEEVFVLLAHSYAVRDFKNHATYVAAAQNAEVRGKSNPLWRQGDLLWDGVVIKEIPEITIKADVGDGGTVDVAPCYMLGAQAAAVAWALTSKVISQKDDYDNWKGTGIKEWRGVEKLMYQDGIQHGMGTLYVAGQPDA